jgi:hypothetical protein
MPDAADKSRDSGMATIPSEGGMRYFDLYHGDELTPEQQGSESVLVFPIQTSGSR